MLKKFIVHKLDCISEIVRSKVDRFRTRCRCFKNGHFLKTEFYEKHMITQCIFCGKRGHRRIDE